MLELNHLQGPTRSFLLPLTATKGVLDGAWKFKGSSNGHATCELHIALEDTTKKYTISNCDRPYSQGVEGPNCLMHGYNFR